MKTVLKSATLVALFTGAALVAPHAFAQNPSTTTSDVKRLMQDNTARERAPGQVQNSTDSAARENAPGQKQKQGDTTARETAPGQQENSVSSPTTMKETTSGGVSADEGNDKRDRMSMKPDSKTEASDRSAREFAPGQQQRTGEAAAADKAPGQQQKEGDATARESAPGQLKDADSAASESTSDETTASIDISTEQRTEIRNVIVEDKVRPISVDFDVRVGIEVPRTVELRPLPPRIIEIVPAYRGYDFFVLADGRIVIVRPNTLQVVYIITA